MSRRTSTIIHGLFFASGAASLMLQVVWFKQIQFVLGSSTFAISVTVAAFFLGLSAGGFLGGRISDRSRRPLATYGTLELILAVMALGVTALLRQWMPMLEVIGPLAGPESSFGVPFTVAASLAVLLPPATLMGATLPLLARHVVNQRDETANRLGVLYALNTLGASVGCATVGFVFIGVFGVLGSALLAVGTYAVIGLVAHGLARSEPERRVDELSAERSEAAREARSIVPVVICSLSGFVAIGYEVVWFRLLRNFTTHTVYAFSGMLSVYLLGLVLGALVCARWIAPKKDSLVRSFVILQAAIALGGTFSAVLIGLGPALAWLFDPARLGLPEVIVRTTDTAIGFMGVAFVVLIVPTTLIGIGFPLASELATEHASVVGRRVGYLYAWNTLAGVCGSLVTGFIFLPMLGSFWTLALLVACSVALFLVGILAIPSLRNDRATWMAGGALGAVALGAILFNGPKVIRPALVRSRGEVLALRETRDATYLVVKHQGPDGTDFKQLIVNSESYANSILHGRRYMAMLAHLPTLLVKEPRRGLVICIGTGTTIGALTTHEELESMVAVDLSSEIFDLAPLFVPTNHSFHQNPRVRKVAADGRHFLLGTDDRFDVMTFEPPPPGDAGVVNLYSEEFYALARRRMRPGGVVAQWIPMSIIGRRAIPQMSLRAMLRQFPHVSLWMGNGREGIAIGSEEPLRIDVDELAKRMAVPAIKEDLHAVGIDTVEDLLATFVAVDGDIEPLLEGAETITDDRPRIEYFNAYPRGEITFAETQAIRKPIDPYLSRPVENTEKFKKAVELAHAIGMEHDSEQAKDGAAALQHSEKALALAPDNLYAQFLAARWRKIQKSP
jgi:spermidine synthase